MPYTILSKDYYAVTRWQSGGSVFNSCVALKTLPEVSRKMPLRIGMVGKISPHLSPYYGRRTLLLIRLGFMAITTLIIGFMGIGDTTTHAGLAYGVGCILLVQYFVYYITLGSIVYTVITEIPSNFLRTKAVVLARIVYNIFAIATGQLVPHIFQTTAWNWGAKSGFFWGGVMCIGFVWCFFRLPETKNRTFAEVDILFKNKISAREFSSKKVDLTTQGVE